MDSRENSYARVQGTSRLFFANDASFWISGLAAAILAWHSMHFRTEGMVAAAEVSAELWQSRHCRPRTMCCLCEYAIGCAGGEAPVHSATKQNIHHAPSTARLRRTELTMPQMPRSHLK